MKRLSVSCAEFLFIHDAGYLQFARAGQRDGLDGHELAVLSAGEQHGDLLGIPHGHAACVQKKRAVPILTPAGLHCVGAVLDAGHAPHHRFYDWSGQKLSQKELNVRSRTGRYDSFAICGHRNDLRKL